MKAIVIKGCRDCPYQYGFEVDQQTTRLIVYCHQPENRFNILVDDKIPETPHPECKLPDLPADDDIKQFAENQNYILGRTESIELGARHVLNAIKK